MTDPILDDLNEPQRDAVQYGAGPLMVLAGAGSGKTRVITRRIAHLMREGVSPTEILALTFTNKAAGEMARRVQDLGGGWVRVATFHSACARFLREDGHHLGYPRDYTIYDTYDRDSVLKLLLQEKGLDRLGVRPAQLGRRISQLKNVGMSPDDMVLGHGAIDQAVEACFRAYQEQLMQNGALDFDDLLTRFLQLLKEFPKVAEAYQERFQWLLIDEFQDTNRVQYDLARRLVEGHENLCVVGDPDQSIYKFRGADIHNILDFERDFPATKIVRLEQNYRSTACILRGAESVIANNKQRKDKRLLTDNDEGDPVVFYRAAGPAQESREIAQRVESLILGGVDPEQIAIFYRSHFLSRGHEEALREVGIPHRIVGGVTFFERREIKDLLAYLRVVVNPLDDVSMARAINVPPRGIGKVTLQKLRDIGIREQVSLAEVVCEPELRAEIAPRARKALESLAEAIDGARAIQQQGAFPVLQMITDGTGYAEHIGGLGDPEDEARVENVGELHSDAAYFDKDVGGGLAAYLQHVSLLTNEDRRGDDAEFTPKLSMMTIHAAKGLEFDHVFVSGLEEGLFPHIRAIEEDGDIEEERRLMYVAMTRARQTLWLGSCRTRMVQGQLTRQVPSTFVDEIDDSCVLRADAMAGGGFDRDYGDDYGEGGYGGGRVSDAPGSDEYSQEEFVDETYGQDEVELAEGVRVVHAVYGHGTILEVQGRGISAKVRVRFENSGDRLLVVEHAGLQIVPSQSSW